jgi:hypothetical protein
MITHSHPSWCWWGIDTMAINIYIYHVGLNTKCGNTSGQYSIVFEDCHDIVVIIWNNPIEKTPHCQLLSLSNAMSPDH